MSISSINAKSSPRTTHVKVILFCSNSKLFSVSMTSNTLFPVFAAASENSATSKSADGAFSVPNFFIMHFSVFDAAGSSSTIAIHIIPPLLSFFILIINAVLSSTNFHGCYRLKTPHFSCLMQTFKKSYRSLRSFSYKLSPIG